jgi:predicted helicase
LKDLYSLNNLKSNSQFKNLIPDKYYDWINQRNSGTNDLIFLGDKKESLGLSLYKYKEYSSGINSNRDAWVYNSSKKKLIGNVDKLIISYNRNINTNETIDNDPKNISWSDNLKSLFKNKIKLLVNIENIREMTYKPFFKQYVYFDKSLIDRRLQMPKFFPSKEMSNILICILTGGGTKRDFTCLVTKNIPDRQFHYNSQCFPLYLYAIEESEEENPEDGIIPLQEQKSSDSFQDEKKKRYAITDEGFEHFQKAYPNLKFTKEDVFYYVYGLLHSPTYREKYQDNLSKELPRIPCVKKGEDFLAYSKAGRDLAKLHIDYEKVKQYPVKLTTSTTLSKPEHYYVKQMKFAKKEDKTVLVYNDFITISEIPLEAYEYIVNGKSALEWIIERYCVKTDKDSGITNDANDWGLETENNPKYPLELFQRIITVSLETMKIVKGLPEFRV